MSAGAQKIWRVIHLYARLAMHRPMANLYIYQRKNDAVFYIHLEVFYLCQSNVFPLDGTINIPL